MNPGAGTWAWTDTWQMSPGSWQLVTKCLTCLTSQMPGDQNRTVVLTGGNTEAEAFQRKMDCPFNMGDTIIKKTFTFYMYIHLDGTTIGDFIMSGIP